MIPRNQGSGGFFRQFLFDIIGIRLAQEDDAVGDPADAEQSGGEQIQDAHADAALVEFVGAVEACKQAEEKGDPLVPGLPGGDLRNGGDGRRGLLDSWIYSLVSVIKFGKCSVITTMNIFSVSFFSSTSNICSLYAL